MKLIKEYQSGRQCFRLQSGIRIVGNTRTQAAARIREGFVKIISTVSLTLCESSDVGNLAQRKVAARHLIASFTAVVRLLSEIEASELMPKLLSFDDVSSASITAFRCASEAARTRTFNASCRVCSTSRGFCMTSIKAGTASDAALSNASSATTARCRTARR